LFLGEFQNFLISIGLKILMSLDSEISGTQQIQQFQNFLISIGLKVPMSLDSEISGTHQIPQIQGGLPKIDRLVDGAINFEYFRTIPFFRIALHVIRCQIARSSTSDLLQAAYSPGGRH
jgi:hypothetical protein